MLSESFEKENEDTEDTESTENEMETEEEITEETTEEEDEEEEDENMKLEEDDDEKSSRRTGTLFGWLAQSVVSAASRRRAHRAMRDAPVEDETDAASIVSDFGSCRHP